MATIDDVRSLAATLPRSYEALVRGRVKFRVGQIVYLAFSKDGHEMGFAFPKEWRNALVESEPEKYSLPDASNMRYHWAVVRLDAVDEASCERSCSTPGRWSSRRRWSMRTSRGISRDASIAVSRKRNS